MVSIKDLNILKLSDFEKSIVSYLSDGYLVVGYQIIPIEGVNYRIVFLLKNSDIKILAGEVKNKINSLASKYFQLFCFERAIYEDYGIIFEGHPLLNPLRYKKIKQKDAYFVSVKGSEIHEVGVGPVHAGIIEPGHFRFQCHGEKVFNLQIELGYQHRGIEENLVGGPNKKSYYYIQVAAGDTTIAHTINYVSMIEKMLEIKIPIEIEILRVIAAELERMANHCGDLGALSNDVAYLPTASFCGRIRGDILNTTALLCGNRFGRNFISVGGINFSLDNSLKNEIDKRLDVIYEDFLNAVELLWEDHIVIERFKNTGRVSREDALLIGAVGPSARASGVNNDVREFLDDGIYRRIGFKADVLESGDVYARAYIRYLEFKKSYRIIKELLKEIDKVNKVYYEKEILLPPNTLSYSFYEGWRGLVFHFLVTDENGKFIKYNIVDPSFHNWQMLAHALKDEEISNFPLCNKSFNLSYCGFDL